MRLDSLKPFFLFFALAIFALGCGNTASTSDGESSDDMAQFANDEEFKAKHETPVPSNPEGIGEMIRYETPDGKDAGAYALMTENPSDKYLLVIHEWWGLNDNIKTQAEYYFETLGGVNVLALDIYDGKVTSNPDEAGKLMQGVSRERAGAIVQGALNLAGESARVATVGWCFGGGWSLQSSIMAGDQAAGCVMYYGMPVQKADELAPLQADILGIFGTRDQWINPDVVSSFEDLAKATGKNLEVHSYDADHAFANPSNPKYDEAAAKKADDLVIAFLKEKLM